MSKKILVVDDDQGILDALEAMLVSEGYDVITTPKGDYLRNLNYGDLPDLILLDMLLSGIDGRDLCKEVKNHPQTMSIPIIMLSAAPHVRDSIREANADCFIPKPFEMEELFTAINKYIKVTDKNN